MWATPLGRWVAAIGHAEPAARLAGVPVGRVKVLAFTAFRRLRRLRRACCSSPAPSAAPRRLADSLLLPAVAAIVVGGTAITGGHGAALAHASSAPPSSPCCASDCPSPGSTPRTSPILYGALIIGAVALTIDRSKLSIVK